MRAWVIIVCIVLVMALSQAPERVASSQPIGADVFRLTIRQREILRWGTGPGTEVENPQVTAGGPGAPPTVMLDNQAGPLGGGITIKCEAPAGMYAVTFDYKSLTAAFSLRRIDLRLGCAEPFGQIRLRPNSEQRWLEFGENTRVTKAALTPATSDVTARPDNQGLMGRLRLSCESDYEGNLAYEYRFHNPEPPVVAGLVAAVCVSF